MTRRRFLSRVGAVATAVALLPLSAGAAFSSRSQRHALEKMAKLLQDGIGA